MRIAYILGSTRSGTSALRNAIAATRFKGYGEGHLAPLLDALIDNVRSRKTKGLGADVQGTGLNQMRVDVLLRHFFHGYERYLTKQLNSEFIVDKTPTVVPIQLAPDLRRYHADARFIYCARRHVDNIQSKLRKFPDQTLEQHCSEWSGCNAAWLDVRDRLQGDSLFIEYHDLTHDPARIAQEIAGFLDLPETEAKIIANRLQDRPEQTTPREITQFLRLSQSGWSVEERDTLRRLCAPAGRQLGYDFEDYFAA